jgi:hypothetical protein
MSKKLKPCPEGKIRNPISNRCIDSNGKVAKDILKKIASGELKVPKKTGKSKSEPKKAGAGQVFNPKSGRMVSASGKIGQSILAGKSLTKKEKETKKEHSKFVPDIMPPKVYVDIVNRKSYEVPVSSHELYREYIEAEGNEKTEKLRAWLKFVKNYNKKQEKLVDLFEKRKLERQEMKEKDTSKDKKKIEKELERVRKLWGTKERTEKEQKEYDKQFKKLLEERKKQAKKDEEIRRKFELRMIEQSGEYEEDEENEEGEEKKGKKKPEEKKGKKGKDKKADFTALVDRIDNDYIDKVINKLRKWYPNVPLKDNDKDATSVITQMAYDNNIKSDKYIQELIVKFKKQVKTRIGLVMKGKVIKKKDEKKVEKEQPLVLKLTPKKKVQFEDEQPLVLKLTPKKEKIKKFEETDEDKKYFKKLEKTSRKDVIKLIRKRYQGEALYQIFYKLFQLGYVGTGFVKKESISIDLENIDVDMEVLDRIEYYGYISDKYWKYLKSIRDNEFLAKLATDTASDILEELGLYSFDGMSNDELVDILYEHFINENYEKLKNEVVPSFRNGKRIKLEEKEEEQPLVLKLTPKKKEKEQPLVLKLKKKEHKEEKDFKTSKERKEYLTKQFKKYSVEEIVNLLYENKFINKDYKKILIKLTKDQLIIFLSSKFKDKEFIKLIKIF